MKKQLKQIIHHIVINRHTTIYDANIEICKSLIT